MNDGDQEGDQETEEVLQDGEQETGKTSQEAPLRSVHTSNFPDLLRQLNLSVLVTTYQAGKLVILRADGDKLNTHFRNFEKPMGLALSANRLAVGTQRQIQEYHNIPAVCRRLEPADRHDACFLPRVSHFTGDVQIHEMAWIGEELWFVNTLFSCLCVRSSSMSFEPRWRPKYVTALTPEDRCHLNGMAVVDGAVKYVTALGQTDKQGGWRDNKKDGGVLIDVSDDRVVATRLSMPHSPRWYRGKLWVLQSGTGGIGTIDLKSGRYVPVAELPGFTRGLSFCGPLAFIGLSQVRESAVFSGFPLVERLKERTCGVWVVNIETGETVAFVRFEDALQEIFAVELISGAVFPDLINHDGKLIDSSYELPNEALADVPAERRAGD